MSGVNTEELLMVANDSPSADRSAPLCEPLEFEPYLRPQVWGGDALGRLLGKELSPNTPVGEAWEICGLPQSPSVVTDGTFAGEFLPDLWKRRFAEMAGGKVSGTTFPLFVKWLDCRELLSVQVHPDDARAMELLGESSGKTEAWVVVDAEPTSRVYAGLKPGISREEFLEHLKLGTVADCLHSFTPKVGDCISLPAGTIHAAGGGVVFAEVQQPSDATFRLFDWNRLGLDGRPRALHLDLAMRCLAWPQTPVNPVVPVPIKTGSGADGESLLKTSVFELDRFHIRGPWRQPYTGEMSIWMVLDGVAILTATGTPRVLQRGSTILLPAGVANASWAAENPEIPCQLLCIRLPSADSSRSGGTC
ncbi:MAG: type I phosphomannose isomerase catalytic subunit [Planctomycetota bacterium]